MKLDIIASPQLSAEDAQALKALSLAVYPPKPGADETADENRWDPPYWRIMIRDAERQLVSHVGVLTRLALCDDEEILIGGIGGVETHPSQRRNGYAAAGLQRAIEFMHTDLSVDMSLLFCGPSMLKYYGRFGFSNFAGDTYGLQNGKRAPFPRSEVMVRPAVKPVPQCAALDLRGLPW